MKTFLLLVLTTAVLLVKAQTVKPLTVGDPVPDVRLPVLLNFGKTAARLSDFKGKLVLLDFFGTYCASCIEALPRFDSLQRKYGAELQVLVVSPQKAAPLTTFLQKSRFAKGLGLPIVAEDTALQAHFPYIYQPHEVWIGKDSRVLAITPAEYVTDANIRSVLAGTQPTWPVKHDIARYNFDNSLLANTTDLGRGRGLYYSALTGHLNGVGPAAKLVIDSANGKQQWTHVNATIMSLYGRTLKNHREIVMAATRQLVEVPEWQRLLKPDTAFRFEWELANAYCYELVLPLETSERERLDYMRQDLNRYFGLNGRIETRKLLCWVVRKGSGDSGKGARLPPVPDAEGYTFTSVENLVANLNEFRANPPVFNESGSTLVFKETAAVAFHTNESAIRSFLRSWGLDLVCEEREVEVFVISSK